MAKELERFCLSVGDSAKDDSSKAGSRVVELIGWRLEL